MSEKKFHEWISSEFEKEADDLERRLKEREAANPELAAMKMPDDSFDDLMRRIEAGRKPFHMQKRVLLAVAAAAVLVVATGVGATGAKLFVPKVENSGEDGEFNTTIINGEMEEDRDVTEEEAY